VAHDAADLAGDVVGEVQQPIRPDLGRDGYADVGREDQVLGDAAVRVQHEPTHPATGVVAEEEVARVGRGVGVAGIERAADHGRALASAVGIQREFHGARRERAAGRGKERLILRHGIVALVAGPAVVIARDDAIHLFVVVPTHVAHV
jgi:hypothetical protein